MHGVVRYRRDDIVAVPRLDARGRTDAGVPVVGDVTRRPAVGPEVAIVGVATQGGRFPPAWRDILRTCIANGLSIENGLHELLADDPELRALADAAGVELRDLRRPPGGLDCATGANLEVDARIVLTVGSDCAIGKMTVSLELDRAARERGSRRSSSRPGRRGSQSRAGGSRSMPWWPTSSRAPAERLVIDGTPARRRPLVGRGAGLARPPLRTRVSRSGSTTGRFRTCSCSVIGWARPRSRARRASHPAARRARRAARAGGVAPPTGTRRGARAEHRRSRRPARHERPWPPRRTRPDCRRPIPFATGADALLDAVLASLLVIL
jgi:hypothetical protein